MKKHLPTGIAIIACILVIACLVQIADLKTRLSNVQNNLANQISGIQSSVNNIQGNIWNAMEEQASLLEKTNWTFDGTDIEARIATIRCAVTPKEYRPNDTAVVLICNDKEYPMTLANAEYTAVVPLPLFSESVLNKVQIINDGIVRTEALDLSIVPRFEFMPQVNANFTGGGTGNAKDGKFIYKREGDIEIHFYQNANNFSVQSIALYEYMDGVEIGNTDIPLNTVPSPRKDGLVSEQTGISYPDGVSPVSDYYYPLNKTVEIPYGSTYEIYIEVVDNYGFHYRVWIEGSAIDSNGTPTDDLTPWPVQEASICDERGNVLWEPYKE